MPRHGAASGYDQVHVCAFCIDLLNRTASSRNQLKSLPLSILHRYVNTYDIIVDAIITAKTPTSTLPPSNEPTNVLMVSPNTVPRAPVGFLAPVLHPQPTHHYHPTSP
ncbi:hypothetical protein F4604DRAFT_686239 [Suillus subluteus]|nr:hypothetical protein F4604DRAFT_686239 [Suillus subluteus]